MEVINNFGILTSISWNSNDWKDKPTKNDLKYSKYDFVIENSHAHEALNFGHKQYPTEDNGRYIAYTPKFNRLPSVKNSQNVNIVFFLSTDYFDDNKQKIIGLYGFPEIGKFPREAKHKKYEIYDFGNVSSLPEHIIYLKNHIEINNGNVRELELLPIGKQISKQGFNYLNSDNVFRILAIAQRLNSRSKDLKNLIKELRVKANYTSELEELNAEIEIIGDKNADTLEALREIEKKMKKASPKVKERVSKYIERGTIANKIKRVTGFKCLICEAQGKNPYSFRKKDGSYYIETHHVEEVSKLKKGSLSVSNLITVCANHHRQLHYGNAKTIKNTTNKFVFEIDEKKLKLLK